mmetsp:Transcript_48806/g.150714  ORF Transcript_48806/g.150714 Transcript_48806/m.150714 type:complete len:254 (+) Transcript_48806:226-987(+)
MGIWLIANTTPRATADVRETMTMSSRLMHTMNAARTNHTRTSSAVTALKLARSHSWLIIKHSMQSMGLMNPTIFSLVRREGLRGLSALLCRMSCTVAQRLAEATKETRTQTSPVTDVVPLFIPTPCKPPPRTSASTDRRVWGFKASRPSVQAIAIVKTIPVEQSIVRVATPRNWKALFCSPRSRPSKMPVNRSMPNCLQVKGWSSVQPSPSPGGSLPASAAPERTRKPSLRASSSAKQMAAAMPLIVPVTNRG